MAVYLGDTRVKLNSFNTRGPAHGKKMLIFGDSITETATMNNDGTGYNDVLIRKNEKGEDEVVTNWPTYISNYLGNVTIKNYAQGSARIADWETSEPRRMLKNQVNFAIKDSENDNADIVFIALGTNDGGPKDGDTYESALSITDRNSLDTSKIYQSLRYAMWSLRDKYPAAKCFVAIPAQRASREIHWGLYDAICKMAKRYGFIIVDTHSESGIIRENEVEGVFLRDGLHPNLAGKKLLASFFASKIIPHLVRTVLPVAQTN